MRILGPGLAALACAFCAAALHAQTSARSFTIHDVRVFDGERTLEHQDVVVTDGAITSVKKTAATAPAGAIDGHGKTLLPGLIDAHTHIQGQVQTLQQALIFGVTTELDMFNAWESSKDIKAQQAAGKLTDAADLRSAGILATAPGGHGTEYGFEIPTITGPEVAQAWVDMRVAEGSDYVKIVRDDGSTYGLNFPTLNDETLRAVVAAAHKRHKLAVVHIGSYQDAMAAINAGADGLAHLWVGAQPDPDFGKLAASHHIFVVATLSVLASVANTGEDAKLAADSLLAPYLTAADVRSLKTSFPMKSPNADYSAAEHAIQQLKAAHVPILAGTDSGNPGTAHGVSMHGEVALLVRAGLTPGEALSAATANAAKAFHLDDRGRIAKGMRADLMLVNGDPTTHIDDTRNIVSVWKAGYPVDRAAYAAQIAAENAKAEAAPAVQGLISDFDNGNVDATFGAGWSTSTDAMMGGTSTVEMKVVSGGAHGSNGALGIAGEIKTGFAYPWAGAMFSPGTAQFVPVNASATPGIRFWAKGDGKSYRVMLFTQSSGRIPLMQNFVAPAEWTQITLPFSAFQGADGKGLMAILFSGTAPGPYSFAVDDVELVKP
jgi:imidazolonepropionase-like amidohydrolase